MKSKIEGELVPEHTCIAAHVCATLRARLVGRVEGVVSPASRELSTLWGSAGRSGEGQAVADRPGAPCWLHPSAGGLGQVAGGRAGPAQWEGTSYH